MMNKKASVIALCALFLTSCVLQTALAFKRAGIAFGGADKASGRQAEQ